MLILPHGAEKPKNYRHERSAKLLAALVDIIDKRVPSNPDAAEFRLGRTLGPFTNWRRVKRNGLPTGAGCFSSSGLR